MAKLKVLKTLSEEERQKCERTPFIKDLSSTKELYVKARVNEVQKEVAQLMAGERGLTETGLILKLLERENRTKELLKEIQESQESQKK